jgi:dihydrodipicolinate reductase
MPSSTSSPTSSTSSLTASKQQLCRSDWLKAFAKTFDALRETGFDDGVQIVKKFIMQEDQIMDDVSIPIAGAANDADASSGAAKPVKHKVTVGQAKASKNEKKTKRKKPKRKQNKNR